MKYYKALWLARRLKTESIGTGYALGQVAIIAENHNCYMSMDGMVHHLCRYDGCVIIPFRWRVSSRETLQNYMAEIADLMIFHDLQEISEDEFNAVEHEDFRLTVYSVGSYEFIMDIEDLAEENEGILSRSS